MSGIVHETEAAGPNDPGAQVGSDAWNDDHVVKDADGNTRGRMSFDDDESQLSVIYLDVNGDLVSSFVMGDTGLHVHGPADGEVDFDTVGGGHMTFYPAAGLSLHSGAADGSAFASSGPGWVYGEIDPNDIDFSVGSLAVVGPGWLYSQFIDPGSTAHLWFCTTIDPDMTWVMVL